MRRHVDWLYLLQKNIIDFRPAAARKFFEEGVKTLDGMINAVLLLQDTYAQ